MLLLIICSVRPPVQAQVDERKLEASLLYSSINLEPFDSRESGAGVRLAYNINQYLSVEAEGTLFEFAIGDHPTDDLLAAMGLIGVKAGVRNRHFGAFAKVRPGVANFPKLRVLRGFCFRELSCDGGRGGNRLAVDAGAVLEVYPTDWLIIRLDVGDTMIRFKDDRLTSFPSDIRIKNGFSHNLQVSGAVGFRF